MSSRHRSTPSEPTTKKKFGKNLNKLTKPPAPPVPSGSNARGSGSSRNGLLLLSTKRSSSGGNATSSGLLSSKSTSSPTKPMQPLGLTTESYSSAHDALLGAVIGASRMTDTQQPPDAWGVAEKQASSVPESSAVSTDDGNDADDVQASYMTQRARERAEQRRTEEEARINEQKERAAERLRQLEEKMSSEKAQENSPDPMLISQRTPPDEEQDVLKNVNRQQDSQGREVDRNGSGERPKPRTLFDPNRPFSSLVAGKPADESEEGDKEGRRSPSSNQSGRGSPVSGEQPSQPVIKIASYEDRDRGERNTTAGPRMLFDPKSGSMVPAPSRDASSAGRGKKGKPKGRREKADADAENGTSAGKSRRGKGRKDDAATQRRDRKRVDENDVSQNEESRKPRGGKGRPENRLPRTCGVLYARDERGICYCADGCDGDQGYGSHSVRGGRVKNPEDYVKFQDQEQAYQLEGNQLDYGVGAMGYEDESPYYMGRESYDAAGGKLPKSDRKESSLRESPAMEKEIDWVKPNEKIELVTGGDDSPSLKPTASPFAPSRAALAAAAAAKEQLEKEKPSAKQPPEKQVASDTAEESDDDEHTPSFVGLGFDPTENMDSVMQSPSVLAKTTGKLDAVELSSLALDVPPKSGDRPNRHIFAFGSSATWGDGGTGTDWPVPGPNGVGSEGQESGAGATSFLSLSSGTNPWGSSGLSGLGGTGGSGAKPTGD